jgi:hypothetical protein
MAKQTISAGSPPILWSTVEEAFEKINANFTELYISLGGEGGIDLTALETSLIPDDNDLRELGSPTKRWKRLYVTDNGIAIGSATISSLGTSVALPPGSTVGGSLIRDPSETTFKTIASPGESSISAETTTDTLNIVGTDIEITTDPGTNTITLINDGVVSATAGTGIAISGTNNITVTNIGVTSLTAGLGLSVNTSTTAVTIANDGIVGIEAGSGISVGARDPVTGRVVVTNLSPATGILAFRRISVSGQPNVDAQNSADILTLVDAAGISITTNLSNRELTFTNTGVTGLSTSGPGIVISAATGNVTLSFDNRVDIVGSVFADDSSRMVDAENKQFFGDLVGSVFGDNSSKLIDSVEGKIVGPVETTSISGNFTFGNTGDNITVDGDVDFNGVVNFDDAIIDWVPIVAGVLVNNGLPILPTQQLDIKGSVFGNDSGMIIDGESGKVLGVVETTSVTTTALTTGKVEETFSTKTGATGTVVHDCANTHVFFHTSIAANFTANFTNLGLESGKVTTVTLILNQGSPAYIPNAVQIAGASQTIQWQGSSPPSGNVNKSDIVSFSIVNDSGAYYVYGQLTSFGT